MKHGAWIAAGLYVGMSTACVSFRFERTSVNVPPRAGAVEGLKPGESSLDQCLQQLGAPLYVWEYQGSGAALAWGWELSHARGVTLSIPLEQSSITAGSYDDLAKDLHGFVLFFDDGGKLTELRRGYLRDLRGELERRRPAAVTEE